MFVEIKEEKKVEYLELIYDLIFVYIIGRNNSLPHHVEGGFISLETFLTYALATLAVIHLLRCMYLADRSHYRQEK